MTTRQSASSKTATPARPRRTPPAKAASTRPSKPRIIRTQRTDNVFGIASVPDKSILDGYIHRQITKDQTDFDIYDFALEHAFNILIEGPTGPGKTYTTLAWAAARGMRLGRVASHTGADHTHLFGHLTTDDEGDKVAVWADGPITEVVRNGGIILVNEVNFLPERVSTVLFGLFDFNREIVLADHKNEVIRAHRPNCWCDLPEDECRDKWVLIVADMNPDYEGTRPLNKAFRNRFNIQLSFDYDPVIESKLVKVPYLLDLARQLRSDAAKGVYDTPTSTNMLTEFERIAVGLGYDFAVINFMNHFTIDERPSLKVVMETHSAKLKQAYYDLRNPAKAKPPVEDDGDSEDDGVPDNVPDVVDPETGKLWKAGDFDDVLGVYGADWWFEEQQ